METKQRKQYTPEFKAQAVALMGAGRPVAQLAKALCMGATIYNMLTGAFPYPFTKERDPIDVILNDDIIPIRKRDAAIPKALAEVIDRAVSTDRKKRPQNAAELLAALRAAVGS